METVQTMNEQMLTSDEPIAYDPNAVLEIEHVARWLRVSVRTVERLDVPCIYLGDRTKRYLGRHVIEYLDKKKVA